MKKVKIFAGLGRKNNEIEAEINKWLEEQGENLVIFSTSMTVGNDSEHAGDTSTIMFLYSVNK